MKKKLKNLVTIISFQIGANIIGLPEFYTRYFVNDFEVVKSKFHN